MTSRLLTSTTVSKTFFTLVLLTRSTRRAEAAMLAAIDTSNLDLEREHTLFRMSVTAALEADDRLPAPRPLEMEAALALLPSRLRPVLQLAPSLRQCFVLHFLGGLAINDCAELLGLHVDQAEEFVCSAAMALAANCSRDHAPRQAVELSSALIS